MVMADAVTATAQERLGQLAMKAIDAMSEFGDSAQMEDALIIMDVTVTGEDDELFTEYVIRSTTHRATVGFGLANRAVSVLTDDYVRVEEDKEDDDG